MRPKLSIGQRRVSLKGHLGTLLALLIATCAMVAVVNAPPAVADTMVGAATFDDPIGMDNVAGRTTGWPMTDLSCPTASLCVGIVASGGLGGSNLVLTSTNPSGGASAWQPTRLTGADPGGLWAISCPTTTFCAGITITGDLWTTHDPTGGPSAWHFEDFADTSGLRRLSCPSSSLCLVSADQGKVIRYELKIVAGGQWFRDVAADTTEGTLHDISCPSEALCVAVSDSGHAVVSTNPGDPSPAWSIDDPPSGASYKGVSCAHTSMCVIVDSNGNVISSGNPTGGGSFWISEFHSGHHYRSVSCASTALCVAVADDSKISYSASPLSGLTTWGDATLTGTEYPIRPECPTTTLCLLTAANGSVVTSTAPTGGAGAWGSDQVVTAAGLTSVDCPASEFCITSDSSAHLITSTNPPGGVASWNSVDVPGGIGAHLVVGLECASINLCIGVDQLGQLVISTNPTGGSAAWTTHDVAGTEGIVDVSCPSESLCVAVDSDSHVYTSTNPSGGVAAWTTIDFPAVGSAPGFGGLDCPTVNLCVAHTFYGQVVTSTNPAGGATTWSVAFVSGLTVGGLHTLSCPTENLCVGFDQFHLVTSTNPTGSGLAWNLEDVSTSISNVTEVSCGAADFCVAVADDGMVATATDPSDPASWLAENIPGMTDFAGVSCASEHLCVAVDDWGQLVRGSIEPALLRVTTSPALPSRITVDGHVADTWGLEWVELAPGDHTVCFSDVAGYETPSCQVASLSAGATTNVTGTFTQRGYLHATTSPPVPSQISIDGHPADNWGLWTDVDVGAHQVCFGAVAGYDPPACQNVNVTAGATTNVTGAFSPNAAATGQTNVGYLRVTTSPPVPSQLTVDGHPADTWGLEWLELAPGSHQLCFGDVDGYVAPSCATANITAGVTTALQGDFTQLGTLKVLTSPPVAGTISIDGNPADAWGVWTDVSPGAYQVCFGFVLGHTAPACQNVNVTAGNTTQITGSYTWTSNDLVAQPRRSC